MPASNHGRFSRVVSFLEALTRGRDRRRRKLSATLSATLSTPAESLESRTLLSATDLFAISSTPLTPTMSPAPGSEIGYVDGEAVFKTGSDIEISWNPETNSQDFDIRIYNVDTGQEVVSEDHLTSPEFLPALLSEPGRYQVFIRHTDTNDATGDWSAPAYFHLVGEVAEVEAVAHFTGVTDDPEPLLEWTAVSKPGFVTTYEVVIYNVKAGQEVLRETTGDTSVSLDFLNDSSDRFQAFIRTIQVVDSETAFGVPMTSDWSAPLYFRGEGDSQIPTAATFEAEANNPTAGTLEWEAIDNAESYEIVIYNMTTGEIAVQRTGHANTSIEVYPAIVVTNSPVSVIDGAEPQDMGNEPYEEHRYQVFYRAHLTGGETTLWSESVEFEFPASEIALPSDVGNDTPNFPNTL